jgi:tripartite-type tricarboxylate transporter receptor subunit TctC
MNVARALAVLGLIAAACAAATTVSAQGFPSKPIKIVVPVVPGTTPDVLARLVGNHLAPRLGQPVIIENRGGASSNIGAEYVARSEPDGHTLMVSPPPPLAINESLFPKLGFDPAAFVPVTILVTLPNVLVVTAGLKARNVEELIALAKASPDQLNGGSTGVGGTPHLSLEMFKTAAGVSIKHIPYSRGLAPALTDLLAGRIDLMFMSVADALPHIRSGQLRALAVASRERITYLPEVPPLAETLRGFESTTWMAMAAPPGTPPDIVGKISREIAEVLRLPDVTSRLNDISATPVGYSPEETRAFIRREAARWREVIVAAGIRLEQ